MKKNTNNQFLIGSWVSFYPFSVDSYEYQLDQMQEAGLNFNIFPVVFGGGMDTPEACDRVEQEYAARNMLYFMNGGLKEDVLNRGVQLAQGKAHCIGYHLKDEPIGDELPEMGRFIRAYRDADGERYPFVNLLPSYAGEDRLGGTYYEHCSRFVREAGAENIEYLSHDFYPFHMNQTVQEIFADMEVIRRVAMENDRLRTHAFPQASAWNGIRMPNIDEMRWNVYAYLAYGFKALSWFNLVCPGNSDTEGEGFRDSIIYRDGTIRDPQLFEDFGCLNREILTLGETLMQLDTIHAYHTRSEVEGVELLPSDWMITPVRDENFVVSHMVNRRGDQTYVMLFNKSWEKTVTASFAVSTFSGIEELAYVSPFDGSVSTVSLENGVFTDTFRPGEGKLYKLNGKVSDRVVSLDASHTRMEVVLADSCELTGVDLTGDGCQGASAVTVQLSTNKRYTADRTVVYSFDEIPADGRIRFEPTLGKYIRVSFGAVSAPGLAEIRVRYADEPDVVVACEAEMEELEETVETAEIVETNEVDEEAEVAEIDEVVEEAEAAEIAEIDEVVEEAEAAEIVEVDEVVEEAEEAEIAEIDEVDEQAEAAEIVEVDEGGEVVEATEPVQEEAVAPAEEPSAPSEPVTYDVDYSDLDDALAVVDGLEEAEYSADSWKAVKDYYQIALAMKDGTHSQEEVIDAYWQLLDHVRELVPVLWTLPASEDQLPEVHHEKKRVHVSGGVLAIAAAGVAGTVAGVFAGLFTAKAKKKKK